MIIRIAVVGVACLLSLGGLTGCAEVQHAAYEGGHVVGEAAAVPGEAVRGANEAYSDRQESPNPYNR